MNVTPELRSIQRLENRDAVRKSRNSHGEPDLFGSATYLVRNSGAKRSATQVGIIGYARVSTDGQSADAQVAELTAAGATKVFQEKVSGAMSDRAGLKRAMASVQAGDILLVTRLDRLARSTRDLLNILDDVATRGGGFRSLRDSWADTTTPHGRLMLTVLGGWPSSSAS